MCFTSVRRNGTWWPAGASGFLTSSASAGATSTASRTPRHHLRMGGSPQNKPQRHTGHREEKKTEQECKHNGLVLILLVPWAVSFSSFPLCALCVFAVTFLTRNSAGT